MIRIDKSVFTPEELETYKALIAKATVDTEAAEEEMAEEAPAETRGKVREEAWTEEEVETEKACHTKKSADPQLAAAMDRLESLEKSLAMKEMTDIAKKYAPLGENEEELAETLYEMRKSNEANYEAYIGVLEKSLNLVEKSGIFAEIGKSGRGYSTARGTVGKIEEIASEIMKSDTTISREAAIMKAWEDHPELIAEYDKEYKG